MPLLFVVTQNLAKNWNWRFKCCKALWRFNLTLLFYLSHRLTSWDSYLNVELLLCSFCYCQTLPNIGKNQILINIRVRCSEIWTSRGNINLSSLTKNGPSVGLLVFLKCFNATTLCFRQILVRNKEYYFNFIIVTFL